jgi:hypothetical protein
VIGHQAQIIRLAENSNGTLELFFVSQNTLYHTYGPDWNNVTVLAANDASGTVRFVISCIA